MLISHGGFAARRPLAHVRCRTDQARTGTISRPRARNRAATAFLLADAELDHQVPAAGKQAPRIGGDRPIAVEPVGAAVERAQRIVSRTSGGSAAMSPRRDIGRVDTTRSKPPRSAAPKSQADEMRAPVEAEPPRIVARGRERCGVDVGADAGRIRAIRTAAPAGSRRVPVPRSAMRSARAAIRRASTASSAASTTFRFPGAAPASRRQARAAVPRIP